MTDKAVTVEVNEDEKPTCLSAAPESNDQTENAKPEKEILPKCTVRSDSSASSRKDGKDGKKEGKKSKKVKDADHFSRAVLQNLTGLQTTEEKIGCLSKKYAELMVEHKTLQRDSKVQQKHQALLQRERDQLQSEHGRALLAKSKLESLCRELQRHNKSIKEESLQRTKEEEEKRKEVSAKFQQTINEITAQMQDNHTRNLKLKEENLELATKLKSLVEQYERREEHIEKLFKHKELESQLFDAKIQQANIAMLEEKERNQREKALLLADATDSQRKCELLTKQESQLKTQLTVYTEKFEEFQSTLTKSNEVFQTFKQEMDKMTKKIKKLESETNMWRVRWENTNKSLLNMAEQKTHHEREATESRSKVVRLEKLCRALQGERNALLDKERTVAANETEGVSSDVTNSKAQDTNVSSSQQETAAVQDPTSNSAASPSNSESAGDTHQENQCIQSDSGQGSEEASSGK
ncbi:beta-taxilin-like [Asterias amurensis]|uniref:beta-taxilin-like n=1 Tax=Asterias amurensis TaxID=7602 RepID=UPI003AB7B7CA